MQTVREVVENNDTTANIYELRNIKSTGVFYYDKNRLLEEFGPRLVKEVLVIKGITGHDAILRIYLKTKGN